MESSDSITPKSEPKNTEVLQQKPQKNVTDRLKKGDDEEQWISGEELYTDGSSDEEGKKGTRRKHKRDHKGARPKEKDPLKSSDSLPKPALVVPVIPDSDNEEPIDISWKPKRGSIKLPHMTKDLDISSSSTSKNSEAIAE